MSLLHTVLLRYDPELSEGETTEMYQLVQAWPEQIGGFEQLAIGPPIWAERARGYQHQLHVVVADEEALERYQAHPAHQRYVAWNNDHGASVLACDLVLDMETLIVPRPPEDAAPSGERPA